MLPAGRPRRPSSRPRAASLASLVTAGSPRPADEQHTSPPRRRASAGHLRKRRRVSQSRRFQQHPNTESSPSSNLANSIRRTGGQREIAPSRSRSHRSQLGSRLPPSGRRNLAAVVGGNRVRASLAVSRLTVVLPEGSLEHIVEQAAQLVLRQLESAPPGSPVPHRRRGSPIPACCKPQRIYDLLSPADSLAQGRSPSSRPARRAGRPPGRNRLEPSCHALPRGSGSPQEARFAGSGQQMIPWAPLPARGPRSYEVGDRQVNGPASATPRARHRRA